MRTNEHPPHAGPAAPDLHRLLLERLVELVTDVRDRLPAARPALLTVAQVAARCGVTAGTVRRWVRRGHLRAQKVAAGGHARLYVPAGEVDRLLAAGLADPLAVLAAGADEAEPPGEAPADSPDPRS